MGDMKMPDPSQEQDKKFGFEFYPPTKLNSQPLSDEDLKVVEILRADFPDAAYQEYKPKGDSGPQLTTLKAQYVKERLTEAFGPHGVKWTYGWVDFTELGEEVVTTTTIYAMWPSGWTSKHSAPGSANTKRMRGDALKAAITDGLTKAASDLGVGHEMFKGNVKVGGSSVKRRQTTKQKVQAKAKGTEKDGAPPWKQVFAVLKGFGIEGDVAQKFARYVARKVFKPDHNPLEPFSLKEHLTDDERHKTCNLLMDRDVIGEQIKEFIQLEKDADEIGAMMEGKGI